MSEVGSYVPCSRLRDGCMSYFIHYIYIYIYIYVVFIFLSSPFLFMYDDDRVIHYTGAGVDAGDVEDAQATE